MKFRLVTAIWGADFVDTFVRLTLPTLLASGNLPALCAGHSVVYTIYTTKEDAERIQAAPVFGKVAAVCPVQIFLFSTREIDPTHFGSHDDIWRWGVDIACRNREIMFFVIPDILYGDGTFTNWARRFEEGYKAVYSPGPQVVLETITDELGTNFPNATDGVKLDVARIHEMLFRHMHPIPIMMDRTSPRRIGHAEYDVRAVPGCGVVVRVLTSHPFCIEPAFFGNLRAFNPADHLDRIAFEPVSVLSAEPLFKHVAWYYRPHSLGAVELTQLGFWCRSFSPPACLRESAQTYDFVLSGDTAWQRGKARARAEGVFFRAQLLAAATAATLFLDLVARRFSNAAQFFAAALMTARLRRLITLRGDETLLVPIDVAFRSADGAWAWSLLAPGMSEAAARLVRDHIVFTGADGKVRTLNGRPLEELDSDAAVAGDPFFIAGLRAIPVIHIMRPKADVGVPERIRGINAERRMLRRGPPAMPARIGAAFRPPQNNRTAQFEPQTQALRTPLRARLRAAALDRTTRAVWRMLERNRNSLRRALLVMTSVPGLRGPAAVGQRMLDYAYRHGLRATITRVRGEFRGRRAMNLGPNRDAAMLKDTLIPSYDTTGLLMSEMPLIVAEATRQALEPQTQATPITARAVPPPRSPQEGAAVAAILRDVRLLRGLEAMASVLDRYEEGMLAGNLESSPARLVRESKKRLAGGDDTAPCAERLLRRVLDRHPDCAEAALELGYLMSDGGRSDDARREFEKASRGTRFVESEADARALAASELAGLLAQAGDLPGAADSYALSLSIAKPQSIVYYRYGEVLRRLGNIGAAREQFAMAMNASHPTWPFPKTGRDARNIELHTSLDTAPA